MNSRGIGKYTPRPLHKVSDMKDFYPSICTSMSYFNDLLNRNDLWAYIKEMQNMFPIAYIVYRWLGQFIVGVQNFRTYMRLLCGLKFISCISISMVMKYIRVLIMDPKLAWLRLSNTPSVPKLLSNLFA